MRRRLTMAEHADDELPAGALETDDILVRNLTMEDLGKVVRIDAASTGIHREEFFRTKIQRALEDSSVQLSLAAEVDGAVVGFLTVAFYFGEFGLPEPTAVLDAIGIHPEFRRRKVGKALLEQLETNLHALRVEKVRTEVDWDDFDLLGFLAHAGYRPSGRICLEKTL
jgi:ribosomal protein S18 acetylase RimI-like enzyme